MAKYVRADDTPVRSWVALLGIIPLYAGIGFAMTGYINFWGGIGILSLTALAFAAHFWLANKAQSRGLRITGILAITAALVVTLWLVFMAAPLEVVIDAPSGNYPKGEHILGLEWREDYSPINITVANDTDLPYENFDSYFRTDHVWIARVGVDGGINQCVATPENTAISISNATLSTVGDKNISIPLFQSDKQYPASIYRVRCDKIAPHSRVNILLALNASTQADWVIGSFRYDAANRHRGPIYVPKCLAASCLNMPSTFVGG